MWSSIFKILEHATGMMADAKKDEHKNKLLKLKAKYYEARDARPFDANIYDHVMRDLVDYCNTFADELTGSDVKN